MTFVVAIAVILFVIFKIRPQDDFRKSPTEDRLIILNIVKDDILDTYLINSEPGDREDLKKGQVLICTIKRQTLLSKLQSPRQDDHLMVQEALQILNAQHHYQFEIEIKVNGIFGFVYNLKVSELPEDSDYVELEDEPEINNGIEEAPQPTKVLTMAAGAGRR